MRFQAELVGRHPYSAVFMVSQYVSEGFLLHRMSLLSLRLRRSQPGAAFFIFPFNPSEQQPGRQPASWNAVGPLSFQPFGMMRLACSLSLDNDAWGSRPPRAVIASSRSLAEATHQESDETRRHPPPAPPDRRGHRPRHDTMWSPSRAPRRARRHA